MNIIGARVTEIRLEKGLKQKELLAKLQSSGFDINAASLSKLEGQTRMVTDKELIIIADALCVEPQKLLGYLGRESF